MSNLRVFILLQFFTLTNNSAMNTYIRATFFPLFSDNKSERGTLVAKTMRPWRAMAGRERGSHLQLHAALHAHNTILEC